MDLAISIHFCPFHLYSLLGSVSTRRNKSPFCGLGGKLVPNPALVALADARPLSASSSVKDRSGIVGLGSDIGSIGLDSKLDILASRSCISTIALARSCSVCVRVVFNSCSTVVSRTGFSTITSLTTSLMTGTSLITCLITGTSLTTSRSTIISLGGCETSSRTFFLGFQL